MRFSSEVPKEAVSIPMTRKRIRRLRSNSRWLAGMFSSSTSMEPAERFILFDQMGQSDSLGNRSFGNPAIPFVRDLRPRHSVFKLLQNQPRHDPGPFVRRLTVAYFRVSH